MKLLYGLFVSSLLVNPVTAYAAKDATQEVDEIVRQEPQNSRPQYIIHSVANILAHVGSIVGDPHNKPNVGQNVGGILGNIVNIAIAAAHRDCKTKDELLAYLRDLSIYLSKEFDLDKEIARIIKEESEEIKRNPFIVD